MKIITIGDIHGKNIWEKIIEKEKDADKIIFIGDYWDSWDESFEKQVNNFQKILAYKYDNPDKVVLLIGNHDYHYLSYVEEFYSGFHKERKTQISLYLERAIEDGLMQMAYLDGKFLFTHAGVTKTWMENNKLEQGGIVARINTEFTSNPNAFKFAPSTGLDNVGDSITQPPIWVRPRALKSNAVEGFTQVVGHTKFKTLQIEEKFIFVDCLDYCNEYLIISDGVPSVGKVE